MDRRTETAEMPVIDHRPTLHLETDVLVVGGGAAGVATAVTAARRGCRVTLVERYGFCGGGAVAGMSGTICGLYEASDSDAPPRQIVHGFAEEFVRLMESRQGLTAPVKYGKTYTRVHDPLVWREVGDALLAGAGVQVIYHSTVSDVLLEGDRIGGVQAYTKEGKLRIRAAVTVDASGDADVAAMAGLATFMGDHGSVQNPTMIFRLMGVDVDRFQGSYGLDTIMPPEVSAEIVATSCRALRYGYSRQPGRGNCCATAHVSLDLMEESLTRCSTGISRMRRSKGACKCASTPVSSEIT